MDMLSYIGIIIGCIGIVIAHTILPYNDEENQGTDSPNEPIPVFRVEDVNGNCATLRALTTRRTCCMNDRDMLNEFNSNNPESEFIPTRSCVTVNLNDFIAIQCLDDVFLKLEICDCI